MSVLLVLSALSAVLGTEHRPQVLVVVGAEGTPEYGADFQKWADLWRAAAKKGNAEFTLIGRDAEGKETDREKLAAYLARTPRSGSGSLWVVLIGHGTDDGREARFNLRGPDVTAQELAEWLGPVKRLVAVVNCASSSGPFINHLSGPNRVVVTATRSGSESNYARFGGHMAAAIANPTADLDKDGQVSLLEAFLTAADGVREFYRGEARLATEHPLIDDNGDKLGSPADWFQGVRAVRRAKDGATVDGTRAHQWHIVPSDRERALPPAVRQRRDELELALANLRDQKDRLSEDEYYARLETIMVELARLYSGAKGAPQPAPGSAVPTPQETGARGTRRSHRHRNHGDRRQQEDGGRAPQQARPGPRRRGGGRRRLPPPLGLGRARVVEALPAGVAPTVGHLLESGHGVAVEAAEVGIGGGSHGGVSGCGAGRIAAPVPI